MRWRREGSYGRGWRENREGKRKGKEGQERGDGKEVREEVRERTTTTKRLNREEKC